MTSRSTRLFVLGVFGPITVVVVALWLLPASAKVLSDMIRRFGDNTENSTVLFSDLLDNAIRRNALRVVPRAGFFELGGVGGDGPVRIAGMVDSKVIIVGGTWMTTINLERSVVEPIRSFGSGSDGLLSHTGRIVSATVSPSGRLWVYGRSGFAEVDMAAPEQPTRVLRLDDGVLPPVAWLGDTIVTSSSANFLRFYDAGDSGYTWSKAGSQVMQHRNIGEPLYPISVSGLTSFFNLISIAVRSDQRTFAVAYRFSDRIHIYDDEGRLERAVAGPVEVKLDFDLVPRLPSVGGYTLGINDETRFVYLSAGATRDMIVGLFGGRNRGQGREADDGGIFAGDELHAFRWDGTLIGTWRLEGAVVMIYVDDATGRIFGVTPTYSIVEFDIGPIYGQIGAAMAH